jgi:hypothetical protein
MNEYISKKELCRILSVSPHTAQIELEKATREAEGVVIRMGRTFRINFNKFIEWNSKKNTENFINKQTEEKNRWGEIGIKRDFTSGEKGLIGLTTMTKADIDISNQLRQRIFKKR